MVSLGQGIVDRVTEEVTEEVTRKVTKEVTEEVTEKLDKEFAEKMEQAAMAFVAKGLPIDQVAECLKLPLSVIQALAAKQASHSTSGGCLA